MAFWTDHPKWDQNPKFTPLNETTSIPAPFIWEFPRRAFHLQSARPAHVFHRWVPTVPIRYFPATKKKQQQKKNVHSYKYESLKQDFLLDQYVKSHTVREMPPVTPWTFYFKHFPARTPLAFSSLACMVTLFIQGISFRYIYIQVQKN